MLMYIGWCRFNGLWAKWLFLHFDLIICSEMQKINLTLKVLTEKSEMLPLWPILQELNPDVTEPYLDQVLDEMLPNGYRMAAVFQDERCLGLSGIWVSAKIYSGKYLEMDNVVVSAPFRSAGIGQILTDFIVELARAEGCRTMMLDAYLENEKAHAFYERNGFVRRGYHFVRSLI